MLRGYNLSKVSEIKFSRGIKGGTNVIYFKLYINYNELIVFSIPAFAPIKSFFRLLKSIYLYKINQLEIIPLGLGLLKSTVVYQHLPTNDGITVGSFGSIEIDTNTGRINGSY